MNRLGLIILTTVAGLAMASVSSAGDVNVDLPPYVSVELAKTLALSNEQVQKIKGIEESRNKALVEAGQAWRNGLQDEAKSGDQGDFNGGSTLEEKLHTQCAEISQRFRAARLAVLTEEQRSKLKDGVGAGPDWRTVDYYNRVHKETCDFLNLSAEQMNSWAAIEMAHDKALAQWRSDNFEELGAIDHTMGEAMIQHEGERTFKAMEAKHAKFTAPERAIDDKKTAAMEAVLTDAQRAKSFERAAFHTAMHLLEEVGCKPTEEQQAKLKETAQALALEKGETYASVQHKIEPLMFSNILTDDQKSGILHRLTVKRVYSEYLPAKLTPDQEAKIEDFYVKLAASKIPHPWAALKDITWGGGEPVEGLLKELSPQIEAMFTKEQKAAMKELQEWKRK